MKTLAAITSAAFALALAGQAILERSTTMPVAPSRMLVVAIGLVAAMPCGVLLMEWLLRRRTAWYVRLGASLGSSALVLALLLAAVRFSGGPLGPIPGARLRGEQIADRYPDWTILDTVRYVQLEMHGPRSVELIVLRVGSDAYVGANYPEWKVWPAIVAAHPDVRLRVGERIYERTAFEIKSAEESRRLLDALSEKYGFDVSMGTGVVRFFRLDPARAG